MAIAVTLTTAAVTMNVVNSVGNTKFQQGDLAFSIAESGAENALLRYIRDPSYQGETLPVGAGTATVSITGAAPITIVSTGHIGSFIRKVQIIFNLGTTLSIVSWKEIQ